MTNRGTANHIYIARVTAVEVTSAIARRRRGGFLTAHQASSLRSRLSHHLAGRYIIIEMTPVVLNDAMNLAYSHGLRAYDAVQLAAAAELNRKWIEAGLGGIVFISADKDLNAAARNEGLSFDDPNTHA